MTTPSHENLKDRVLDAVFGKRGTPEEHALAKAAQPPREVQTVYAFLHGASFSWLLVMFLWSYGWLPFVESRVSSVWFWSAFGVNLVLRTVWDEITKRYERRIKARLSGFA